MRKQSKRRLAENEVIFREANVDAKDFMEDSGAGAIAPLPFFCECSRINCRQRIELSIGEYEAAHANKRRFILVPGHEIPEIERVVDKHDGYNIVEKVGEIPIESDLDVAIKRLTY